MRTLNALFALSLTLTLAVALAPVPKAQAADSAQWKKLKDKTLNEGTVEETATGATAFLSRINPSATSIPRSADYFSIVLVEQDGGYTPESARVVVEKWTQNEAGNFVVDNELYWIALDGTLTEASRVHFVISNTPDREVTNYQRVNDAVSDASTAARFEARLADWFKAAL